MASLEIIPEKSGRSYTDAEKAACAEEKNASCREPLARMSPADLSVDVKTTLETLRENGLKLAIGSSSKNTPSSWSGSAWAFFDRAADGNCITHSKPHPEVFLKAAYMIGLSPRGCPVVEDAHAGVEAAAAGRFDCAAIGNAKKDKRARWHLERFSDLLRAVAD